MKVLACSLLLLAVASAPDARAEVYKWKDKDGRIVYGGAPPSENIPAEKVNLPEEASPEKKASAEPADWQAKEREFQQRRIAKAKEEDRAAQAEAQKKQRCAALQREKQYLSRVHGRRVARWNSEKGEYEYLSDEDRAARETWVQETLEQHACE